MILDMRILGIDPGTATVGFGAIDLDEKFEFKAVSFGTIKTKAGLPTAERLDMIYQDLREILESLRPEVVAVEQLFAFRNVTTVISVSQARGVILLAAHQFGCPLFDYTPMVVKMAVTGYGKAEKREVQESVRDLLGLATIPRPDDAADALAIAICHAHHLEGRKI
jgi:crossover junction endodeoxyribonuclease RuvC